MWQIVRKLRIAKLLQIAFIFSVNFVEGMQLRPISMEFSPSGKDSTRSFIVKNDQSTPAAVLVSVAKRDVDLYGKESNPEVEDEFALYPSQLVLMPEEEQTVQVTWIGGPQIKSELAYRLIAEQLPIKLSQEKGDVNGLQLMFKYIAALYVTPLEAKADLVVDSCSINREQKGEQAGEQEAIQLLCTLWNKGTGHLMVREANLEIKMEGAPLTQLQTEAIAKELEKAILGTNMLAGLKRQFSVAVDWPKEVLDKKVEIVATFNENKN